MTRPQKGFSLLELLVAVAVFAAVSAVAYGGLSSVLQARQQTERHARQLQELQQALGMLQRDLSQALARPVRDPFGDQLPAFYQQQGGYLLAFTRAGRPNLLGRQQSELRRIAYALEEEKLVRYLWPVLDAPQGLEPYAVPLLEGVIEAELRFLDDERQWHENWPPADRQLEPQAVPLPLAVELTLELEKWGEIRRLIPLVETAKGDTVPPDGEPGQDGGLGE